MENARKQTVSEKIEEIQNMLAFMSAMFTADFGSELSGQEKIGGLLFFSHISQELEELCLLTQKKRG